MEEVIQHNDKFYILASSTLADDRTRVLKQGQTFVVFDRYGDIRFNEQGVFHQGTRYLSRLEFRLEGGRPLLLSSNVVNDNGLLAVDLTNPDMTEDHQITVPRSTIHVFRSLFIWNGTLYQRVRLWNYGHENLEISFSFLFDSDFADIFEVRGMRRQTR